MREACYFRHEEVPLQTLIELDGGGVAVKVCPSCLVLIVVHRRIHHMKLEQVIPRMAG